MPHAPIISRCWLSRRAARQLTALASTWFPLEAGGILLGHVNGSDAVVVEIIGPGPAACHEHTCFFPDHDYQREEVARLYRESDGRVTYLGDWHTHPRGPSNLSDIDQRTLRAIAKERDARCSQPLMLLLSHGPDAWDTNVFCLRRSRLPWSRRGMPLEVTIY